MTRNTFNVNLYKVEEKAGIRKRFYPYLLRHSRAMELYLHFHERELMYLLGAGGRGRCSTCTLTLNLTMIEKKYLSLYGKAEKKKKEKPKLVKYPRCGFKNNGVAIFYARCGYPLRPGQVVRDASWAVSRRSWRRGKKEKQGSLINLSLYIRVRNDKLQEKRPLTKFSLTSPLTFS